MLPKHICVFLWFIYVDLDWFLYFTVVSLALEELNDSCSAQINHNWTKLKKDVLIKIKWYTLCSNDKALCDSKVLCNRRALCGYELVWQ